MGMFDMMGKLNELRKNVEETKSRLTDTRIEAESGRGLVSVQGNALRKLEKITIDETLLRSEKKEELEALLLDAVNEMLDRAREKEEVELKKAAGGLIPPGLGI